MRLDVTKIDDRIRKLQELKRVASDPEMASIIMECVSHDQGAREITPEPPQIAPTPNDAMGSLSEDASDVVKGVLAGHWNRKRA